ncbi:histidine phosphatase family protein [Histidinibacterium aquaticum]|uniref:Histidine phosphatase family protein n=1 Tax=Histidinibacterium aquaticum TaxID=2613962 RepID=A0A5J5GQ37_9RHOB|nr:histidine phosphatase family protein [Histidinibacterium aquaticum]KAA9010459.1 histidine phosphatase family protein [Histidinibacterium aquaticum]
MSRWFWVRHGPTHQRAFTGHRDVPADLSDLAALERLRQRLPSGALVVASDLTRASATADAIAQGRDRLPDRPGLREFDFGDWDGKGFAEVSASNPELSRRYWDEPGDCAPPNGESWNEAAARVERVVADLRQAHPGRDMIVVAHLGVILTRLHAARGGAAREVLAQPLEPLSLTELRWDGQRWSEISANETP